MQVLCLLPDKVMPMRPSKEAFLANRKLKFGVVASFATCT
jgi:hypothetical protein